MPSSGSEAESPAQSGCCLGKRHNLRLEAVQQEGVRRTTAADKARLQSITNSLNGYEATQDYMSGLKL